MSSGLGKVAERASGARRKLARPAGREGRERRKGKKKKEEKGRKKNGAGRKKELVIQGSHMVSGTRCPAWSDQVK